MICNSASTRKQYMEVIQRMMTKSWVHIYHVETETVVSDSGDIISKHKEGKVTVPGREGGHGSDKSKDYLLHVYLGYIMVTYVCVMLR